MKNEEWFALIDKWQHRGPWVLIDQREVMRRLGITSRTTLKLWRDSGLITKAVSNGARSIAWPEHEIDEIVRARAVGVTAGDLFYFCRFVEACRMPPEHSKREVARAQY